MVLFALFINECFFRMANVMLVRRHTSIPVPRVLSWSSDASNSVGSEYIIMTKATGVPLFQQWGNMS